LCLTAIYIFNILAYIQHNGDVSLENHQPLLRSITQNHISAVRRRNHKEYNRYNEQNNNTAQNQWGRTVYFHRIWINRVKLTAWRRFVSRVDLVLLAKLSSQFTIHLSASHLHTSPKDHSLYTSQDNSVHSQRVRRYNCISMNI